MHGSEGTSIFFKYRIHDTRIGRFLSVDPLTAKYPHNSPYAFSENRVVDAVEIEGLEAFVVHNVEIIGKNAVITIISDEDIEGNFDCDFQLKLPDGSIHQNWAIEGLQNKLTSRFEKRDDGYYLDGRRISSTYPFDADGIGGKDLDFTLRVPVPTTALTYNVPEIVARAGYTMVYNSSSQIKSVDELKGERLKLDIQAVGGDGIKYNRLDVYVPNEKREIFLEKVDEAGIDREIVNFVDQENDGSTMGILPVRVDIVEKTLEETE